jgi:hypothetical protein
MIEYLATYGSESACVEPERGFQGNQQQPVLAAPLAGWLAGRQLTATGTLHDYVNPC